MSAGAGPVREWVSFEEADGSRTWLFDVTFLSSPWGCLFGRGCQGVLTAPSAEMEQGCCSYGAHMTGEEDASRVEAAAATLSADQWQYARRVGNGVLRRGPGGTRMTRLVDGACVFLNRPGFARGAGCALHTAALDSGRHPLELKPDVCWQLPIRREESVDDHGRVTVTITQWQRSDWGRGGEDFAWWCSEDPAAYRAGAPVWETMADELAAIAGDDVYRRLAAYLAGRRRGTPAVGHPVTLVTRGRRR